MTGWSRCKEALLLFACLLLWRGWRLKANRVRLVVRLGYEGGHSHTGALIMNRRLDSLGGRDSIRLLCRAKVGK
ncbi:hypothetical protein HYQ46_004653 [Verticillium longisporum]|nr:hypothetical protein HYQ46_004653 [Verticillium longisporum]